MTKFLIGALQMPFILTRCIFLLLRKHGEIDRGGSRAREAGFSISTVLNSFDKELCQSERIPNKGCKSKEPR